MIASSNPQKLIALSQPLIALSQTLIAPSNQQNTIALYKNDRTSNLPPTQSHSQKNDRTLKKTIAPPTQPKTDRTTDKRLPFQIALKVSDRRLPYKG